MSRALILLFLTALGCAGKRANLRAEPKEEELLSDSARLYWEGVRWGDADKAAAFVENPDKRLVYKFWFTDQTDNHRYVDVTILQVTLDPEPAEPSKADHLRTAKVFVHTEGYDLPAQILRKETITQGWYRSLSGWWVEWEPPDEGAEP